MAIQMTKRTRRPIKRINYERLRDLGVRLRKWREAAQLTQHVAADRVDVAQTTLSDYERGTKCPPESVARAIEALTGGTIAAADWLGVVDVTPANEGHRPTGTG